MENKLGPCPEQDCREGQVYYPYEDEYDSCDTCSGSGQIVLIQVDLERGMGYCQPCLDKDQETQGYDNWEIFGRPEYFECIDCLEERTRNRKVPQEWVIDAD